MQKGRRLKIERAARHCTFGFVHYPGYTTRNKSHFLTTDEDIENAMNQGKAFGENADIFLAMGKHKDAEAVGLSRLALGHNK